MTRNGPPGVPMGAPMRNHVLVLALVVASSGCDDGYYYCGGLRYDPAMHLCVCDGEWDPEAGVCHMDAGAPDSGADAAADSGCATTSAYADGDGDGWGAGPPVDVCDGASGFSARAGDCDDGDPAVHPGASEICDAVDSDCDGDEGCPGSCTYAEFAMTSVLFCADARDWNAAAAFCESMGWRLADVRTPGENTWMATTALAIFGSSRVWLGGIGDFLQVWTWPDGTVFWRGTTPAEGGMPVPGAFQNFGADAPSQNGCLQLQLGGGPVVEQKWFDANCGDPLPFVCERSPV